MHYPKLKSRPAGRQMLDIFRGYNHNTRISEGEFYHMENLTSDAFPLLSPRNRRGIRCSPASPQGLIARDELCHVDGSAFVLGDTRVELGLSTDPAHCPKRLVSMGAWVIILPDKRYINTLDIRDFGDIEAVFETEGEVTLLPWTADGNGQPECVSAPEAPETGDWWIDTSSVPHTLRRRTDDGWTTVENTRIRLEAPGIGRDFAAGDGVMVTGIPVLTAGVVIEDRGEDFLILPGLLEKTTAISGIRVERTMPEMDFVTECGNRLWGCRYGTDREGLPVNQIYASKLGDFKNWNVFQGISTDSYAAGIGSEGPFTAAVTHLGHPIFFRETCLHKVYGSYPGNFQIQTTGCPGVQRFSDGSLALVGQTLYYKSPDGVCAYDGSFPQAVSRELGPVRYSRACAGAVGNKYYISMMDGQNAWHLFVYDTLRGLWHREDDLHADAFAAFGGELYCIDRDRQTILALLGSGEPAESEVRWMAETGELTLSSPQRKILRSITLRLSLDRGSSVDVFAQYDRSGEWEQLCHIRGTTLQSFAVPVRPRRCDHLKLRLEGRGPGRLYSWTKSIEEGSDLP